MSANLHARSVAAREAAAKEESDVELRQAYQRGFNAGRRALQRELRMLIDAAQIEDGEVPA